MFVRIGKLDAADKKTRNQKPRDRATILALMAGVLGPVSCNMRLAWCPETMKRENADAIYRGIWPGLGRMYNVKVGAGHTTIFVRPGEDLEQRVKQTLEKFARKDISLAASVEEFDGRGTTRSRISQFKNKFREMGSIDSSDNGELTVDGGLLSVVAHDSYGFLSSSYL